MKSALAWMIQRPDGNSLDADEVRHAEMDNEAAQRHSNSSATHLTR
ncbi:hypothetical protein [Nocardia tengchongensis]